MKRMRMHRTGSTTNSVYPKQDMTSCYQCLRIRIFLGHPDPDTLVLRSTTRGGGGGIQIRVFLTSSKNIKKTLDSHCLVTFLWLFIFENLFKCSFNKFKLKQIFSCHFEDHRRKKQDPLLSGTDPQDWKLLTSAGRWGRQWAPRCRQQCRWSTCHRRCTCRWTNWVSDSCV